MAGGKPRTCRSAGTPPATCCPGSPSATPIPATRGRRRPGEYLVGQLAQLQAIAPLAGYAPGYLSAFPEYFFDWLEEGRHVWSPYYMIHKYMAGMIDQYQLAGVGQALDVATRLADWVGARTARLSYAHMQQVLVNEFGGLPEALANLYRITGSSGTWRLRSGSITPGSSTRWRRATTCSTASSATSTSRR